MKHELSIETRVWPLREPFVIARSSHTQRWMVVAIGLLSVLLVLQLLLADRANLARDPRWRP